MRKEIYRVDNVPFFLKPSFFIYSHATAAVFDNFRKWMNKNCNIVIEGERHPAPFKNHIYTAWHEDLLPYFIVHLKYEEQFSWINHPLWFMKPVHITLQKMGVEKIFLGSSGHGGRAAINKVIDEVKAGSNTFINPDGPAGPPKVLKNGVLEMSLNSGIPVVPIKFQLSNYIKLSGWDRKKMPLPFSTIKMIYQQPVLVTEENFEEARAMIARGLG